MAFKETGDEHQFAVCDKGYTNGKKYIEFKLETEPDENNIIVGVTKARIDYYCNLDDCKNFWGFLPAE